MDIDVKQSLAKLLLACSKEQELIDKDGGHLNVKQVILNNIAGFIEIISLIMQIFVWVTLIKCFLVLKKN